MTGEETVSSRLEDAALSLEALVRAEVRQHPPDRKYGKSSSLRGTPVNTRTGAGNSSRSTRQPKWGATETP